MTLTESQITEAREWYARLDALAGVGRLFSTADAAQLREGRDSLSALLSDLDDDGAPDPKPAALNKALGEAKKAAGEAADGSHNDLREQLSAALNTGRSADHRIWVRDVFDDAVIYEDELDALDGITTFRRTYSIDAGGALTFGDPERVRQRSEWVPLGAKAGSSEAQRIAVVESAMQVQERAVTDDGTALIKAIGAGWGSSGYYSEDVLRDSGPAAFPAGTHMYWDHPTEEEAEQRPERSLRDLAAVLTEDAAWDDAGPDGPGLYAHVEVKKAYRGAVDDMAEDIGTSIRTWAMSHQGEADGREGPIIEEFIPSPGNSVDFVTLPGRGGSIALLYESYRHHNQEVRPVPGGNKTLTPEQHTEALEAATKERDDYRIRAERAETAVRIHAARDLATVAVNAIEGFVDEAKKRVVKRATPVLKDGEIDLDATKAAVEKDAADEADYLSRAGIGRGRVSGMGSSEAGDADGATQAALDANFARMGLSESAAKSAARGRSI